MFNLSIVIPTLDPSEKILTVVKDLKDTGFDRIIIVNDGSRPEKAPIFDALEKELGCTVLVHEVNRGKGRALKTAMSYFVKNPEGHAGIITLDDDGQHTLKDTVRVGEALIANPDDLILGVRDFDAPNVPPKSKFGNKLTKSVMKALCRVSVSDTQTGLRAIPLSAMEGFIATEGERFEYETNMLLDTRSLGINITEVVIDTVYIEDNKGTHFHPIRDSIKIYKQIFKYAAAHMQFISFFISSGLAFVIDNALFFIFALVLPKSLETLAYFPARAISSLFNYFTNQKIVFNNTENPKRSIIRYYILCVCQLCVSFLLVNVLIENVIASAVSEFTLTLLKLLVEFAIFPISFVIQRKWVFSKK